MSYESTAEPIKVGYLMDFTLPPGFPEDLLASFTRCFDLVFEEAVEQGLMDRPVQMIYREVEGLPKGSVKAVIDAFGELVDEGCLVVFGPNITDNCVPTREAIEERFRVPAISVTGTDDWLGEWTFSFPQGSMTDEPIFLADLVAKRGMSRDRCPGRAEPHRRELSEEPAKCVSPARVFESSQRRRSPRQRRTSMTPCVPCTTRRPRRSCISVSVSESSSSTRRSRRSTGIRRRFTTTAFQNAWVNPIMWNAFMGWVGVDQYDEGNPIGQDFLDRYAKKYDGSRPEYCVSVVNRDVAATLVRAFTDAHPLSPRGVKEALERVKMMPAASGAPGTRVSLGKWTRRAWMGSGYLVARTLDADGINSHLVDRFGEEG